MSHIYNKKKVRISYDRVAEEYARQFFHELDGKPFDRNLLKWFAGLIPDNEEVVEMGCGPGEIACFLKKQGIQVSGMDISENMVSVASRLNPDIHFYPGDMLDLYLNDQSIFAIVAFYAIIHFSLEEVKVAFREFKRVLKKGGYVLFSFHVGTDIISVDNFLDQADAPLDFVFFEVDDILNIIEVLNFNPQEVIVRYPYKGAEYESKRAYILIKKD